MMKLPETMLAGIEYAINRLITEQPEVVDPALSGKLVCIDLAGMDLQLYFHFIGDRIVVMGSTGRPADAGIKGTPIALAAAGLSGQANTRDIHLSGDLQLAQVFEALLKNLDIDWEEIVSRYTGDAIAFRLGESARGFRQWGRNAANALMDDLRDYLQVEGQHLPLPTEVDDFNRAVDEIRASTERFELRVQRLQDRLSARIKAPAGAGE